MEEVIKKRELLDTKIWVIQHIDDLGIKWYWYNYAMYQSYTQDINHAQIFLVKADAEVIAKTLIATKPTIVEAQIQVVNEIKE